MPECLAQFNFLDIIIILIAIRIFYSGFQMGLAVEFFKLSGVILATFLSLHYYAGISSILRLWFTLKILFLNLAVFVVLAAGGYLVFVFLRNIFYRYLKLEAAPRISQFGGLILGTARLFFTTGLLIYILMISGIKYLNESVKYSYLGSRSVSISADTYTWLWSSIISKFFPDEKLNSAVSGVLEKFNHK